VRSISAKSEIGAGSKERTEQVMRQSEELQEQSENLQSLNEELQAQSEELQSVNGELFRNPNNYRYEY